MTTVPCRQTAGHYVAEAIWCQGAKVTWHESDMAPRRYVAKVVRQQSDRGYEQDGTNEDGAKGGTALVR